MLFYNLHFLHLLFCNCCLMQMALAGKSSFLINEHASLIWFYSEPPTLWCCTHMRYPPLVLQRSCAFRAGVWTIPWAGSHTHLRSAGTFFFFLVFFQLSEGNEGVHVVAANNNKRAIMLKMSPGCGGNKVVLFVVTAAATATTTASGKPQKTMAWTSLRSSFILALYFYAILPSLRCMPQFFQTVLVFVVFCVAF